jgi:hypothetical protein
MEKLKNMTLPQVVQTDCDCGGLLTAVPVLCVVLEVKVLSRGRFHGNEFQLCGRKLDIT